MEKDLRSLLRESQGIYMNYEKKNILIIWEGLPACSLLISELIYEKDISLDLAFTNP